MWLVETLYSQLGSQIEELVCALPGSTPCLVSISGKEKLENSAWSLHYLSLEVMHITPSHISRAHISRVNLCDC